MRLIILSAFLYMGATLFSQEKVKWSIQALPEPNNLTNIKIRAEIEIGWHIYSIQTPENSGPIPISVVINKNRSLKIKGGFIEKSIAINKFDANFDSDVFIFEDKFLGELKVKVKKDTELTTVLTYMVCNEVMCLPPIDCKLSIKLHTNE